MTIDSILGEHNAIVVAHPDDETLWAGGLPIVYSDRSWTVICCSIPRRDPVRAWKFYEACVTLGAMPRLLPMPEQDINTAPVGLNMIDLNQFDCVVTHNEWGEYGHFHHQQVHQFVKDRYKKPFLTFGYRPGDIGTELVRLTDEERRQKIAAMQCYNHILEYEGQDCTKWEALMHRYYQVEGLSPDIETYDIHG